MSWIQKFFRFREKSDGEIVKPFLDHMEDLRWTIIKIAGTVIIAMIISFSFRTDLMRLLQVPLVKAGIDPKVIVINDIAGSFILSLQLAFFAGFVLALPLLIYFLAEFILPALTRQEKKFLLPGIAAGCALFICGALISYHYILPHTLKFFKGDAEAMQVTTMWNWHSYISFCSWLTIGFGLMTELPVVVIVLALLRIVSFAFLARTRPYAVTLILILAAIVAPSPDPMTFITLALPIVALYEACIWVVWLLEARRRKQESSAKDFPD